MGIGLTHRQSRTTNYQSTHNSFDDSGYRSVIKQQVRSRLPMTRVISSLQVTFIDTEQAPLDESFKLILWLVAVLGITFVVTIELVVFVCISTSI